jgi:membrane-bound serine protease (ClpP class)
MKTIRGLLIVLGLFAAFLQPVRAQGDAPLVLVMTVDGPIFPNTQQYIARGITTAEQRGAELLVLQLNTPGGDSESMFGIMQSIRASTVPVVIYVTPRGVQRRSHHNDVGPRGGHGTRDRHRRGQPGGGER